MLTLEVSGRCHSERQITVARRSGPLDRIVRPQHVTASGKGPAKQKKGLPNEAVR